MWLALIIGGLLLLAVRGTIGVDFGGCLLWVVVIGFVWFIIELVASNFPQY